MTFLLQWIKDNLECFVGLSLFVFVVWFSFAITLYLIDMASNIYWQNRIGLELVNGGTISRTSFPSSTNSGTCTNKYVDGKGSADNFGHQEISGCHNRGESKEFIAHMWQSGQLRDPSWLWNPGQTSPEVQKRGTSGPTKKTDVLQNVFENLKIYVSFHHNFHQYCSTLQPLQSMRNLSPEEQKCFVWIIKH